MSTTDINRILYYGTLKGLKTPAKKADSTISALSSYVKETIQPVLPEVVKKPEVPELADEQTLSAKANELLKVTELLDEFKTLLTRFSNFLSSDDQQQLVNVAHNHGLQLKDADTREKLSAFILALQSDISNLKGMIIGVQLREGASLLELFFKLRESKFLDDHEKQSFSSELSALDFGFAELAANPNFDTATAEKLSTFIERLQTLISKMKTAHVDNIKTSLERKFSQFQQISQECKSLISSNSYLQMQFSERHGSLESNWTSIMNKWTPNPNPEVMIEDISKLISDLLTLMGDMQQQSILNQPTLSSQETLPASSSSSVRASSYNGGITRQMEKDSRATSTPTIVPSPTEPTHGCGANFRLCSLQ